MSTHRLFLLALSALCLFTFTACPHYADKPGTDYYDPPSQPLPFSPEERARFDELRVRMAEPAAEIADIIARNPNIEPMDSVRSVALCFTGPPSDLTLHASVSSDITFPDEIVLGDGVGCALDPPGISCECPCPE